ncbi:MAG: phosphodiester glycosidase family protein [Spirulinaceae cyanobacterium SM2_1_0]|nr:phosphodiester glycosidase family protein [Spirulinaceae cyanobacterium SM2_1_0]
MFSQFFPARSHHSLGLLLSGLPLLLGCQIAPQPNRSPLPTLAATEPAAIATPAPALRYEVIEQPQAKIHLLLIPNHPDFTVVPVVAPTLAPLAELVTEHQAIAAINGGFFDPQNGQTTSTVIRDRLLVADPRQNPRLTQNPDLTRFLPQIFNRSEWRRYRCAEGERQAIAARTAAAPNGCRLQHALGAGPRLLPELAAAAEGFVATAGGQVVRDALGRDRPNARSAIGLTADGTLILAMASQEPAGVSLPELAAILEAQGAIAALNLDGGSSSSLYHQGKFYTGQRDADGNAVLRPLKSALIVRRSP